MAHLSLLASGGGGGWTLIKKRNKRKGTELEKREKNGLKGEIKGERVIWKDLGEGAGEQLRWCE